MKSHTYRHQLTNDMVLNLIKQKKPIIYNLLRIYHDFYYPLMKNVTIGGIGTILLVALVLYIC